VERKTSRNGNHKGRSLQYFTMESHISEVRASVGQA
jgi:hypothetical protein